MASGISLKIPLAYDKHDGPYALLKELPEVVKQNFKNLILTIPGERIMNPDFGVGVHNLLFEQESAQIIELFNQRLGEQVQKYMPFIQIVDVNAGFDNKNTLHIMIKYFITSLGISDKLALDVGSSAE
jgi:phage baseplate assembly protein W